MSKNAINVIKPYKWEGMWVFDDERVELDKEPFVAGADTMIDKAIEIKGIKNADNGFLLVFSEFPFPDAVQRAEIWRKSFVKDYQSKIPPWTTASAR